MRKIILAVLSMAFLFTACQKNEPVSKAVPMGETITGTTMNAQSLTVSEMHDMVCLAYWEKYGFSPTPALTINRRATAIADSLFGIYPDVDSVANMITGEYQRLGLLDANGYFKVPGNEAILASTEPNTELKSAFLDIINSAGSGAAHLQWVAERLGQVTSTDAGVQERAKGFLDIYIGSSNLPYNELFSDGGGFARADAAGFAYGWEFVNRRGTANSPEDWMRLPLAFAFSNSINNASCYEM